MISVIPVISVNRRTEKELYLNFLVRQCSDSAARARQGLSYPTGPDTIKPIVLRSLNKTFSFFLPMRLNLRGEHHTGFGIQVQRVGGGGGSGFS